MTRITESETRSGQSSSTLTDASITLSPLSYLEAVGRLQKDKNALLLVLRSHVDATEGFKENDFERYFRQIDSHFWYIRQLLDKRDWVAKGLATEDDLRHAVLDAEMTVEDSIRLHQDLDGFAETEGLAAFRAKLRWFLGRWGGAFLHSEFGSLLSILTAPEAIILPGDSEGDDDAAALAADGGGKTAAGKSKRRGRSPDTDPQSEELKQLEVTTPPFNKDNGQWLRNTLAAKLEGVETRTLAQYRQNGIAKHDKTLGRDGDGRVWRRPGTRSSHPWYLRSTLKCEQAHSAPKP